MRSCCAFPRSFSRTVWPRTCSSSTSSMPIDVQSVSSPNRIFSDADEGSRDQGSTLAGRGRRAWQGCTRSWRVREWRLGRGLRLDEGSDVWHTSARLSHETGLPVTLGGCGRAVLESIGFIVHPLNGRWRRRGHPPAI